LAAQPATRQPVKPDDHSEVVPLLPIPNRKVKRLCADDSAGSRVKVGHCQANIKANAWARNSSGVLLLMCEGASIAMYPSQNPGALRQDAHLVDAQCELYLVQRIADRQDKSESESRLLDRVLKASHNLASVLTTG